MKRVFKIIGLLFILLLVYIVALQLSVTKTVYQCDGEMVKLEKADQLSVYLKLEEWGWVIQLTSDGRAGVVWIEIPQAYVGYSDLVDVGTQYQIWKNSKLMGNFSKLSKTVAINFDHRGFFDGQCRKQD